LNLSELKTVKVGNLDEIKELRITNLADIPKPIFKVPDIVKISEPDWLNLESITSRLDKLTEAFKALPSLQFPTKAKDAIAVRLSDGEEFYKAIAQFVGGMMSGGSSIPTVTPTGSQQISVPVVNPNGSSIGVVTSTTPTVTSVPSSASSVQLLASNTSRKGATIANDSTQVLYIKLGTTATTSSYTIKLNTDDYYEVPFGYTGRIDGIWASANGNARITELT
jgi:hypothetical protein